MNGRRRFLRAAAGALGGLVAGGALAPSARALGDGTRLKVAQVRHGGTWNPRPTAALSLAEEVRFRTSIDVALKRTHVGLSGDDIFSNPFLLMLSSGELPRLGRTEGANLKRALELGGFLLVDNVGKTSPSEAFDRTLRAELRRLFPARELERIPSEHVIYRSFYRVDYPAGRILDRPYLEGLDIDGRLAVIYSRNDLSGAWARDSFGNQRYDVIPGGEQQREMAIRLGINLVMYALCLDYKDDHAHLDYLLRRRNWRITPPGAKEGRGEERP